MKFEVCRGLILVILTSFLVHGRGLVRKDCVCGEANVQTGGRIVNGRTTTKNKYPWVAGMFFSTIFMCGGAIISDRNILTAGHCYFYMPEPLQTFWILGMHNRGDADGKRYYVSDYQMHPKFKNFTIYDNYDMTIVRLRTLIKFTYAIKPICFNKVNDNYAGMKAIVAGWGRLHDASNEMATQLQETKVQVKKPEECEIKVARLMRFDDESMICAHEKETDSCNGDSGGPLFVETHPNRYEIIGLVSFGDRCAKDFPGIYSKTANAFTQKWIKEYILASGGNICSDPVHKINESFFSDEMS